jgi:nitrite reductase/ring-hydroxylating ferredoxin subunit/uncharacterized membrane protein
MGSRVREMAERVAEIEPLDGLADPIGKGVSQALPQGMVKDLVSGTWLGHPVHPMLTDVVVGSWVGAAFLDLLGRRGRSGADALVGLGILAAVPTALTGLSDWADTTGEPRRIGLMHGLGNVAALSLYVSSWKARRRGRRGRGVVLSMLGAATATLTQYLGGHLVFERGIGVNRTAFEEAPERWTRVAELDALQEGMLTRRRVEGLDVLFYRRGSKVMAIADRCSHRGGPLHEGETDGTSVTCPWHGSVFRLADGEVLGGPATGPQEAYQTRIAEGVIEVRKRTHRTRV